MTQCKFRELESDLIHGGIIDDDGNVICGYCGRLIEADKVCQIDERVTKNHTIKLIEIYENCVDLSEEICCDDLYDEEYEEDDEEEYYG